MPRSMAETRPVRLIVAFAVAAVLLRAPAILYPVMGEDEAAEAAVSALVAGGAELYRDAVAPEAPLGYWLAAAVYRLAGGYAQRAVHVLSILAVLATMAVLAMASRALSRERAGLFAAIFYAVFSIAHAPPALGANAELWAALCASVAIWLLLGGAPGRRYGVLFAAGAAAAAGALFRHAGTSVALAALAYLLAWRPLLLGRAQLVPGALGSASFLLGFAITYAVPLGYLESRDALAGFAREAWVGPDGPGGAAAAAHVAVALGGSFLMWFLAVRDIRLTVRGWRAGAERGENDAAVALVLTWLGAAAAAAALRARGGSADLLALTPALALLGARGCADIADDFWAGRLAALFRMGVAIPAAAFFCAALFHEPLYRQIGARKAGVRAISEALRSRTGDDERVWVLGEARRVYVYARRAPAARDPGTVRSLPDEVRGAPPRWVVDAGGARPDAVTHWLDQTYVVDSVVEGARLLRRKAP
jgi:hypothetical protein